MRARAVRYLLISQLSLAAGLLICVLLLPHFLFRRNEGGISNYGVHARTVAPFTLGFLGASGFAWEAARLWPHKSSTQIRFRQVLWAFSGLLLLVLLSTYPYKHNHLLDNLHIGAAIILACFETPVAYWLMRLNRDALSRLLFALQLIGFIIAIVTFVGAAHLLFVSQIIMSFAFGWLLVRSGRRLL